MTTAMTVWPPSTAFAGGNGIALIAAVSLNGIIGLRGQLPWSIPEVSRSDLSGSHLFLQSVVDGLRIFNKDRRWLMRHVRGGVLVLGRRSFEETGRPLPGIFRTIVVSRNVRTISCQGVETAPTFCAAIKRALEVAAMHNAEDSLAVGHNSCVEPPNSPRRIWIGGGEQIYSAAMHVASHLVLTQVHEWVEGDARFPVNYRSYFPSTAWEGPSIDTASNTHYTFKVLSKLNSVGGEGPALMDPAGAILQCQRTERKR
mmetsp:Transcript_28022/g.47399  ORF Transcript_28022/g.47399 Transcript_28022/m.47399 type:complete len:257 (+) Transcript_28022:26-796(+)